MNEVSCRVFDVFDPLLKAKGLSYADLVAGTSVSASKLGSKKERIDWADFVSIMRNARPHFTDEEYIAVGHAHLRAPGMRFAFVIARLALSPIDLYRWLNRPRAGLGKQLFSCIVPNYREFAANQLVVELRLLDGFEMCWDFFTITKGNMEALPQLFGLPLAKVVLSPIPGGARYEVTIPTWRVPLRKRLARWLERPFVAWTAARELKDAHETLAEVQARMGEVTERLNQAKELSTLGILTSGLAHEIRNPANGITNAIEPLRALLPKDVIAAETGPQRLRKLTRGYS